MYAGGVWEYSVEIVLGLRGRNNRRLEKIV
jgi:hypothetical protein